MFKKILTFSLAFLLAACTSMPVKEVPADVRSYKRVDFFVQGRTQVAFKIMGQMDQDYMEGVLRIKKMGPQDFDVLLMTGAAYRVLHAIVSPEGVAYRYLFKEADTAPVRVRVTQFLNLLLGGERVFHGRRFKQESVILTYKAQEAKEKFFYHLLDTYPYAAQSITLLNTGDLTYQNYTEVAAATSEKVPHTLTYKDGNITLDLHLISLR